MGINMKREKFEIIGIQGLLEEGILDEIAKTVQRYFPKEKGQEVHFQVNFSVSTMKSGHGLEFITMKGISVHVIAQEAEEAILQPIETEGPIIHYMKIDPEDMKIDPEGRPYGIGHTGENPVA